ncbi:hypothetical protein CC79DRAFT_1368400 [Sarocladium strictum]
MTTIPPSSRVIADEDHPPCVICRAVDFPSLLDWRPGNPRPWIELSHTITQSWVGVAPAKPGDEDSQTASSTSVADEAPCPYCTFFRLMIGQVPDESGKFTPYLRIRQAFEKLGVKEKAELGKGVLVEVTTKDKDLPWGYILKTADDASTHEGPTSMSIYQEMKAVLEGRVVPEMLDPLLPKTWFNFCREHHEDTCEVGTVEEIPGLRLIDCETKKIVLASVLEEGATDKYAALSYVWNGDDADLHLNVGEDGQLGGQLPQLFADALVMAEKLGLRYLWVDKCCLPQSTASERPSSSMIGDIFHQAAVTLIPASDDTAGIPGVSSPREEQLSLSTDAGLFTTSLIRPDLEVASCRWATQARTFQEGLFSRRRLVFTPSQCYFQCCHLHCHESIGVSLHLAPTLNLGRVFASDGGGTVPGHFKDQVKAYMPRDSASSEERLAGFEGLLKRYQKMANSVDELLGIPLFHRDDFNTGAIVSQTDRLAVGLGWLTNGESPAAGMAEPYYYHREDGGKGLPTWTWLSWHMRPDLDSVNQAFRFSMVGETSPVVASGVSAPPDMEISVGFEDGKLLSWEIDGDVAVRRKRATPTGRISYLRVLTWCFDLAVRESAEQGAAEEHTHVLEANLPKSTRARILNWYLDAVPEARKSPSTPIADALSSKPLPDPKRNGALDGAPGDANDLTVPDLHPTTKYPRLVGMVLSGRGWKTASEPQPASTTTSSSLNKTNSPAFTILICITESDGDDVSDITKIRRLGAIHVPCDGFAPVNEQNAILRGVETDTTEKKALKLDLREVDLL